MVRKQDSAPERIQAHQHVKTQRSRVSTKAVNRRAVSKSITAVRRSWASLLWMTVLLSGAGLVGGVWLSLQLFVNPDAISWVNYLLPEWAKIPLVNQNQPQTLTQIRANLSKLGQIPGEVLSLETDAQTLQPNSVLLPVISSPPNCQIDCQQIVELQVYELTSTGDAQKQLGEVYYQLVSQVPVEGPEESFAITPLLNGEISDRGSSRPLPLTQLRRFEGITPADGVWFYLWGQRLQGSNAITYGQVVHYNPSRSHLSLMLPWTSPIGQPQWQQVISDGSPELVVNQTVDLEPQLLVYQVKPAQFLLDPLQLELISLAEPALNNSAYQRAIKIARTGLWSPAWKWLQFIKQQQLNHQPWSAQAQAQTDLIRLYAQLTKSQAEKTWASPSQQVLADLIDGRWGEGLRVFQASSPDNTQEIVTLLAADSGRLWNRVEVALQMNPDRPEVKAWGALILGAKEGRRSAIVWLKRQPRTTPATITYMQNLLKRLEGDFSTAKIPSSHSSRMIGSVQLLTKVNLTEWLQPIQKAALKPAQQWYQVQIAAYHDGKRWRRTPFSHLKLPKTAPGKLLWQQLGLDTSSQIQIIVWLPDGQQEATIATVKAVQLQGGVLRLLAAAEKIDDAHIGLRHRPLALTQAALEWVQSPPLPLVDITQQQQPVELAAILPVLWQELQKLNPRLSKRPTPSFEQLQEEFGQLPVQLIELTGDTLSEVVLTVSPEPIATLDKSLGGAEPSKGTRSRTIIFSNTGKLLYSEFSAASQQAVAAIADLKDDEPPALLVEGSKTYSLQRWSVKRHRFE